MKAIEIYQTLKDKKGQHVSAVWKRPCKTLPGIAFNIAKRTETHVRAGIEFANLASVKNGIESGKRDTVGKLPCGQWRKGYRPFIIDHKGEVYVRLYPSSFGNLKSHVEYTMDGMPATYEQVAPYLLASEKRKNDNTPECFTLRASSILSIGD